MRNTLPLLSRPLGETTNTINKSDSNTQQSQSAIPSIRLLTASPSATGLSSEVSSSFNNSMSFEGSSWGSFPSTVLAPKPEPAPKRRLVPKKSKLGLLNVVGSKDKENKRPNATSADQYDRSFEIYVDPTLDPELGEILMVKKKKSRAALDGMRWGPLGEVTNVPASGSGSNDKAKGAAQPQSSGFLKVKGEEKDKWWSIGRGRKDSKDKSAKEGKENKPQESLNIRAKSPEPTVLPQRAKTPEPLKLGGDNRARFNSLDSVAVLKSLAPPSVQICDIRPEVTFSRTGAPTAGGLLAPPPAIPTSTNTNQNQGSIAIRAMRSVRSLARIGSWAQLRKESSNHDEKEKEVKVKESSKKTADGKKEKKSKKSKKGGKKEKAKEKAKSQTGSLSSFEVGALPTDGTLCPSNTPRPESKTLGRKVSVLGLGLPSSVRLPTLRSGSTNSSVLTTAQTNANRLSVESAFFGRGRSGSVLSNGSSLRPPSTASSTSRVSSQSISSSSVRWDEEGLETVKELRRKEKQEKVKEEKKSKIKDKKKKKGESDDGERDEGSRRSSEGRRRVLITDVFPDTSSRRSSSGSYDTISRRSSIAQGPPLLTVEEATSDGHSGPDDDDDEPTPTKRTRPRPVSEQLLGKARPTGLYENDEGVLSILDAATNDLAQLIMTLNLEATPGNTPNATPLRRSTNSGDKTGLDESITERLNMLPESPLRRKNITSIASLRSYAQSLRRTGSQLFAGPRGSLRQATSPAAGDALIGQQIAPWSKLLEGLSPKKQTASTSTEGTKHTTHTKEAKPTNSISPTGTFRKGHRRQATPAPEPEPAPVFQPLRPAVRPKNAVSSKPAVASAATSDSADSSIELGRGGAVVRSTASSNTFGSPSSVVTKKSSKKRSFLNPAENEKRKSNKVPIPPETKRVLGMSGTLGGSDVPSIYAVPEMDASDPNSDIPDELQFILSANSDGVSFRSVPLDDDDTFSFPKKMKANTNDPVSPPPSIPLPIPANVSEETSLAMELPPVFRARVISDIDERENVSDEDTANSFDFTGELRKLDDSDRKSFVEQLENAFRTPAKVDLNFDLGGERLLTVEPPLRRLPFALTKEEESEKADADVEATPSQSSEFDSQNEMFKISKLVDEKEPTVLNGMETESSSGSKSILDLCVSESQILNVKESTHLRDSLMSIAEDEREIEPLAGGVSFLSTQSSRSNGQLNTLFKFGGKPKPPPADSEKQKPLTLSDIIPPPSHARSLSGSSSFVAEEDSVLKSIYSKAKNGGAAPQPRPRVISDSSVKRRNRVSARSLLAHSRRSSALSFTGFDSFEEIRRGFEFSGPRPVFYPPSSGSNSTNHRQRDSVLSIASVSSYGRVVNPGVIDPFGFSLPSLRERPSSEEISTATFSFNVDDTFSFIRHPSRRLRVDSDASSFYFRPPLPNMNRGHRRQESSISTMSMGGPPVSFYNRAAKRMSDSSASSVALSYATHGGRASWATHRYDPSIDSVMSDMSALKLGRPGLGDKMFDNLDQCMPLSSISASPPAPDRSSSLLPPEYAKSSSYDSIMDVSGEPKSSDSIFDKTGQRASGFSDSVFGTNDSAIGFQPQYRPVSVISTTSIPSSKEDDTWISMIGGGHVRRHSVASGIKASPCARVEKRKKMMVFNPMNSYEEEHVSPKKPRIIKEPSIASTSSYKFGDEWMINATKGLLQRQSLEENCLVAEGEDSSISFSSVPVFSRPMPAGRSRSSTCTSSSGGETPPLSSDGSSMSGGSQSSIDMAHLNSLLANATFPLSNEGMARTRARARARGQGHRRRYSAARTSLYETIEEEVTNAISPARTVTSPKFANPTNTAQPQPIVVVESDTGSLDLTASNGSFWDSEHGIVALNRYFALRHEAEDTVVESKRVWVDTPFSIFAVQNFQPPRHPEGMKALLQHSVQNYGPLPSHLRPRRRSRTYSRPSPYPSPLPRVSRVFHPPEPKESLPPVPLNPTLNNTSPPQVTSILQDVSVNSNIPPSPVPSFTSKALSPEKEPLKRGTTFGQPPIRPRVASSTRRAALGWTKRNVKSSNGDQKENKENKENVSMGSIKTPGESLRLNRPRPRGRPTPATRPRPIRV